MNDTLALLQSINDTVQLVLVVVVVYGSFSLVGIFVNHYLEARRLKLLIQANPEVLAIEFLKMMNEYLEKYGPILRDSKPHKLVAWKSLGQGEAEKILVYALLIIIALYSLFMILK